jgi:RimJ/RimL family protein N-acetyltransferase
MLHGKGVTLREWRESDLEALAALRNDVGLQTLLMAQARPNSADRVRTWLTDRSNRSDMVFFVIADAAEDAVLGYLQVADINSFQGHGDLGICLSPRAHGRDLAREACTLLEQYLRGTLSLRKLTLKVLTENERAIAFYRKQGYRDVGVLEQHFRISDKYCDVLIMERQLIA